MPSSIHLTHFVRQVGTLVINYYELVVLECLVDNAVKTLLYVCHAVESRQYYLEEYFISHVCTT